MFSMGLKTLYVVFQITRSLWFVHDKKAILISLSHVW